MAGLDYLSDEIARRRRESTSGWAAVAIGGASVSYGIGGGSWVFVFRSPMVPTPQPVIFTAAIAGAGLDVSIDLETALSWLPLNTVPFTAIMGSFSLDELNGAGGTIQTASAGVSGFGVGVMEVSAWARKGRLFSANFTGTSLDCEVFNLMYRPGQVGALIGSGLGRWSVPFAPATSPQGSSFMPPARM